jgi:hypothetical protein
MDKQLMDRLRDLIHRGYKIVNADDITDVGRITIDAAHSPNGKQSGIGSFFREAIAKGLLEPSNLPPSRSKAKARKGGMIQNWQVTDKGRKWAGTPPPPPPRRRIVRVPEH